MNYLKRISALIFVIIMISVFTTGCQDSGYVIGVATGTTYQQALEGYEKVSEIKTLKDDNMTLLELSQGRLDGVVSDRLVALNAIQNAGYDNLDLAGDFLYEEVIGIGINAEDDALRQAINEVLAEMIEDGTYAQISEKYFGRNILEGIDYERTYENEEPADDDSLQRVLDAGEITFSMSGGYPPFNYYDENDELIGFDVDMGKEIAKRLGVTYAPVTGDFSGLVEGLRSKRYDGILGSMAITEERLEVIDFTNPYYYSGAQLIVLEDSEITSADDLK